MDNAQITDADVEKLMNSRPLVKSTDMTRETVGEIEDIVTSALEKHSTTRNYEAAAQLIKNVTDKRFGPTWHCVVGEGYGFDITYQQGSMAYIFFGHVGVIVFKA